MAGLGAQRGGPIHSKDQQMNSRAMLLQIVSVISLSIGFGATFVAAFEDWLRNDPTWWTFAFSAVGFAVAIALIAYRLWRSRESAQSR